MAKYKVVGAQPVLDHQPGETFELSEEEAAFLVQVGALKEVKPKDVSRERRSP